MVKEEKTEFGRSVTIVEDMFKDGKRIAFGGVNFVNAKGIIPLHTHDGIEEEYTSLTEGMKIIVLPADELEKVSEKELMEMFKTAKAVRKGETVVCARGQAHALYNDTDEEGMCFFIKYYL